MVRGNAKTLLRVLMLAASISALSAGLVQAQQTNDLDALAQRILDNPQDVELNLSYAAAAEAAGKPRLALVAYERILINDPTNEVARRGYERVRRTIEPGYTITRIEVGARYDTNAANINEDSFFAPSDPESTTYFAKLMVADERELGDRRWRSIFNLTVEDNDELDELDYGYAGAQTGPIFYVAPHLAAIPSIGVGAASLDGDLYFTEYYAALALEGRAAGISYWARVRAGQREYEDSEPFSFGAVTESGGYVELQAGLTKPRLLLERDMLTIQPFIRWNSVDGDVFGFAPGSYEEYGVDANYNYQLTDHVQLSAGALVREREFDDYGRTDSYLSPQASVTLQRVLPCDCDVRMQYRTRDNDSNDFSADYDAEQITLSLAARF